VSATKPAAVLIPIIDRGEPTVLLTLRTAELASHAGQVAFPGGKIDPSDESPVAAAMREAKEEIGLAPVLIEPIGYLDLYLTFSGFRILPTVARVKPDFSLTLNPWEVKETFEVPLEFLMTPGNHQRKTRDWKGIPRDYYAIPFGERYIWGITAGILRNLYDRIYGA
jgi:8-oxo-dGTP pyrophosphatase MutT (NUDIX family)